MAEVIGTAVIEVKADTKPLQKGFRTAQKNVSTSGSKMETGLKKNLKGIDASAKKASGSVKGMGFALKALASGVILRGLKNMFTSLTAFGSRITDMATQTGLTTDEFQALDFIFIKAGVSSEKMIGIMAKLNMAIGQAKEGISTYTDAFDAAGISMDKIHALNTRDVFVEIAKELANATRGSIKYAAIMELLGAKNVPKAEEAILKLAEGFDKAIQSAREAGAVMDKATAVSLDVLEDRLQLLEGRWQVLKSELFSAIVPLEAGDFEDTSEEFGRRFFEGVKKFFTTTSIKDSLKGVEKADLFDSIFAFDEKTVNDGVSAFANSLNETLQKELNDIRTRKTQFEVKTAVGESDIATRAQDIFGVGEGEEQKLERRRNKIQELIAESKKLAAADKPGGKLKDRTILSSQFKLNQALDLIEKEIKLEKALQKEIEKENTLRDRSVEKLEKLKLAREKIGLKEDKATPSAPSSLTSGRDFINVAQRMSEGVMSEEAEATKNNTSKLEESTTAIEVLTKTITDMGPAREAPRNLGPEDFGLGGITGGV